MHADALTEFLYRGIPLTRALQLRVIEKTGQAVLQNGFTRQLQVLLGPAGTHAAANPGGGDQSPEMR